jgi:hypothetical protein
MDTSLDIKQGWLFKLSLLLPSFFNLFFNLFFDFVHTHRYLAEFTKGAPGLEFRTGPWLVSLIKSAEKKFWTSLQLGPKTLI